MAGGRALWALCALTEVALGQLTLAPYFSSHAVLQHGGPLPIFGTSTAGDVVSVTLNGGKFSGTTGTDGVFRVMIPSQPASSVATTLTISSTGSPTPVVLSDILLGDVFIVAGEGNVLMTVSSIFNASTVVAGADAYAPMLRLFQAAAPAPDAAPSAAAPSSSRLGHSHGSHKKAALKGIAPGGTTAALPWSPSSSALVGAGNWTTFSAVGYLLGKHILDSLATSAVPVGILVVAAGGSPLQAWAGPQTWAACPNAPLAPRFSNSSLFNALIAPLVAGPLAVAGVVLWQGETNSAMAVPDRTDVWFACALPAFVAEIRSALASPSLFVGIVQLPPVAAQFWTDAVPNMREVQRQMNAGNTAVVAAVDTGDILAEFTYLHARNKDIVARRLADAALTIVYKQPGFPYVPAGSPVAIFVSQSPTNLSTVTVSFADSVAPYSIDPSIICPAGFPEGDPNNLWISYVCQQWRVRSNAADGTKWYDADATVSADGKSVTVTAQLPAQAITLNMIEYCWAPWPAGDLHDANSNPIYPFQIMLSAANVDGAVTNTPLKKEGAPSHEFDPTAHADHLFSKLFSHVRGRKAQSWMNLVPNQWLPLPLGAVQASGWLARQLQVQVDGLSGSLFDFYPPVAHSPFINVTCPWPGGCQDTNEGEDFGYLFQAAVPLALLTDPACSGPFCKQISGFVDMLLASADPASGWIGPPADPTDSEAEWARWLVISGLLQWQEFTHDARIMPAIYKHLHESFRRLSQSAPLTAWSQARYQDYVWLLEGIIDKDPQDLNGQRTFLTSLMWVVAGQQGVPWETYFDDFFPRGNTGWNFSNHGVNMAEGLKSGAVLYRLTGSPYAVESSHHRLDVLDLYHGAPHGTIFADETMADSMPSHGIELCLVVETMLSLYVMHEALGDASFADRAERVAYNALPGTWTQDMWAHQYLQQPNGVNAMTQDDHVWLADGSNATQFGVAPNYPCCAANGPQGWPRLVPHMVHGSADGGFALSILGPLTASIPLTGGTSGGATVGLTVATEYPFADSLDITITAAPAGTPFYFRIPGWATAATLSVDGGAASSVGDANGTMYKVVLAASGTHTLHVELNPAVFVDSIGILYNGAIAVHRGALLYGLRLDEVSQVVATTPTGNPAHPQAMDLQFNTTGAIPWNVALVFDPADPAGSSKFFTFARAGGFNSTYPFTHDAPQLTITASARQIPAWGLQHGAAGPPPSSPACATPSACGTPFTVTLVPYGMTHLRMSVLPWTPQ